MRNNTYKILFHFENAQMHILEIRRNGVVTEDMSKLYYWLVYDTKNDTISALEFKTMQTVGNNNYRVFLEGKLEFDNQTAVFAFGKQKLSLKVLDPTLPLSAELSGAVADFLTMLNLDKIY